MMDDTEREKAARGANKLIVSMQELLKKYGLENINLKEEVELIKQKKSNLSSANRQRVMNLHGFITRVEQPAEVKHA